MHHTRWSFARALLIPAILLSITPALYGQTFTAITAGAVTTETDNSFGAAWVDIDNDFDLDLYVANAATSPPNSWYRNEGDGTFTKITDSIILNDLQAAVGTCWADYDNDGDLDVFNAGIANSFLYRNDGLETFTKITDGDIGGATDNRGWSCAWGDVDNDGFVDLFIAHPAGFLGPSIPNSFFFNDGGVAFTRVTDSPVVMGLAPYTVGNWIDYDDDGDVDLFIGSGPAIGTPGPDFLYRNERVETGIATFARITDLPLNDERDGQTWNFIDYDNDGDRDGFVTNYSGFPNNLYRNDGGTFVEVTTGALVTDAAPSLANVWADFDNDGDLDVVVTNEIGFDNVYYRNDGPPSYTFTRTTDLDGTPAGNYGAAAGDVDLDGDLDLFMPSHSSGARALYQTEAPPENHWVNLRLVGTSSNRSGVGAKVRARASIAGQATWQRREVSTQNTFNGHNSLNVHFGLGDAGVVEELEIVWPSGTVDVATQVEADLFYVAVEGEGLVSLPVFIIETLQGRVDAFVAAGTLNHGQGNALQARLKAAAGKLMKRWNLAAWRNLEAFQHQVSAFIHAGIFSEAEGQTLVGPATTALTLLRGPASAAKGGLADPVALLEEADAVPEAFSLAQNHPNPFNPSTTIAYTLPTESYVTLRVYDMQGRVVATLADGFAQAGTYQAPWDATQMASGVYLYRLVAGDVVQSRLMHLVK